MLLRRGDVDGDWLDAAAELQLEQVAVALGRPQVQVGQVAGAELEAEVVALIDHGGCLDDLEVVGVQAVGQPQQGGEASRQGPVGVVQGHVVGVAVGRQGLAVVAGDVGHQVAFSGAEPVQVSVADGIERVLVVARLTDRVADVVEQAGDLEQPAFGWAEPVQGGCLVEQGQGQGGDLAGVGFFPRRAVGRSPAPPDAVSVVG